MNTVYNYLYRFYWSDLSKRGEPIERDFMQTQDWLYLITKKILMDFNSREGAGFHGNPLNYSCKERKAVAGRADRLRL